MESMGYRKRENFNEIKDLERFRGIWGIWGKVSGGGLGLLVIISAVGSDNESKPSTRKEKRKINAFENKCFHLEIVLRAVFPLLEKILAILLLF